MKTKPACSRGIIFVTLLLAPILPVAATSDMKIERLPDNPIITPASSATLGANINGPSLIRVPAWVDKPLGRYYLYFAHHKGKHIRLAWADHLGGPWTVHEPGALALSQSRFPVEIDESSLTAHQRRHLERVREAGYLYTHIASPEVVVVPEKQEIRLYFHGLLEDGRQATRVAVSRDGMDFETLPAVIARPYLRVFEWQGAWYGMAMPGVFYRSEDGLTNFTEGPTLFDQDMRHAALMTRGETLYVFWTRVGDAPERILLSTIDLSQHWMNWRATGSIEVLRPETKWEGASLPISPSVRGAIEEPVNQLRDPAVFEEKGRTWLLYSIAGESGIGIAEIKDIKRKKL